MLNQALRAIQFCVFLLAVLGNSVPSLARPVSATNTLSSDPRLDRLVTIDEIGIPLGELLQKISDKNLKLSASDECVALKLQLRLKQRPLRAIMTSLAELLPGTWKLKANKGDNSGYMLSMNVEAIQRREDWWQLFFTERNKALAAQRAFVLQQMRTKDKPATEYNLAPEQKARMTQGQDFFRMLPESIQEQVAAHMNECAFCGLRSRGFGTPDEEGAITVWFVDLPRPLQDMIVDRVAARLRKEPGEIDWNKATIEITNGGIALLASVNIPNEPYMGTSFGRGFQSTSICQAVLVLDHTELVETVKRLGDAAPEGWKQLADYQQSTFWKNDLPKEFHPTSVSPRRADVLQGLGNTAGVEFVADYYSKPGVPVHSQTLTRPLKEDLNYLAVEQDTSWRKRADNIYLFRNNRWYRDDYLEVPAPLLRRWYKLKSPVEQIYQSDKTNRPPTVEQQFKMWLDREAEFVTQLTPWQIATGLTFFTPEKDILDEEKKLFFEKQNASLKVQGDGINLPWEDHPFWQEAGEILHNYNTMRFYAGLDDDARTSLLEGHLDFSSLLPIQKDQALYLLPRLRVLLAERRNTPLLIGLQSNLHGSQTANVVFMVPVPGRLFIVPPTQ